MVIKNIISSEKTKILDKNSRKYFLDKFNYQIEKEILKGENILIITNSNLPESDKVYFSSAIIDTKNKKFRAKDTKLEIHKNVFGNKKNDPRLFSVSSSGDDDYTLLNKGVFTSCKKRDDEKCPPWSIKAKEIIHDKKKKQINYKDAVLNIYDLPVLYFPKFFHPDPTVKRQTGFLQPSINNSNVLGSSVSLPYFKIISDNKDITFSPIFFDSNAISLQNEYRQINKNSDLTLDFGYVKNYKSSTLNKKKKYFPFIFKL